MKTPAKSRPRPRAGRGRAAVRRLCRHRRVVPGATWLISKKTNDDTFWLTPDPLVDACLLYLLTLKAKKYGILVHAFFFASNHFHLLLTDPRGRLPDFMREFLGESAKAIQCAREVNRKIWSGSRYSSVQILDRETAERKGAYLGLQSMEAGLTEPAEWPGLTSFRHRFGETIVAKKPEIYVGKDRPETVELVLEPFSKAFLESGDERADGEGGRASPEAARSAARQDAASEARIRELVEARSVEIRASLAARKERLAGPERVLDTRCTKRSSHPIRTLNPRFATRDKERLEQAIAEHRQFEIDHEAAKQRYIAGDRHVKFPWGTYGYRRVLGVRVARRRRRAG